MSVGADRVTERDRSPGVTHPAAAYQAFAAVTVCVGRRGGARLAASAHTRRVLPRSSYGRQACLSSDNQEGVH